MTQPHHKKQGFAPVARASCPCIKVPRPSALCINVPRPSAPCTNVPQPSGSCPTPRQHRPTNDPRTHAPKSLATPTPAKGFALLIVITFIALAAIALPLLQQSAARLGRLTDRAYRNAYNRNLQQSALAYAKHHQPTAASAPAPVPADPITLNTDQLNIPAASLTLTFTPTSPAQTQLTITSTHTRRRQTHTQTLQIPLHPAYAGTP